MLLHPTRFEPFGLTPLYAMRYGAIPIGSRVGGLVDTVCDADRDPQRATGVLFEGESAADMQHAVARAFALYNDTERWQSVQRNAMSIDCDWAGPTRAYIDAYAHVADMAVRPLFAPRPLSVDRPAAQAHAQPERMVSPAAAIAAALAGVVGVPAAVAAA